jgi:hypothetical protein
MANFGKLGDLNKYRGPNKPTGLPQWLLDQMSANTTVDEGGGQKTEYSFNNNALGGFQRDGKSYVQVGQNKLKDPSKVIVDPDLGEVTETDNAIDLKPQGPNYAMLAATIAAPLLMGALGAGAAGGAGAAEAGGGVAAGEAAGGAAAGSGLSPLTGVSLAPETTIGTMGTYGGAASGAGGLGALGAEGASGAAGSGLTPLTGVSLAPETSIGTMGSVGGASGGGSLLSQAGSAISNNPLGAARLGLGLAALGGAAHGSSNASGGSGTDAGSIIDQMANANRVDQNTPLGSRRWAQGADGRWTVNDTMNPAEQSNFENVQGLNAGVTGATRDMLARILAQPTAQRADRPIVVGGRTIGG